MFFPFPVPASHLNAGKALGILKFILVLPCADSRWVITWGFYSVLLPTLSNYMYLSRSTRLCPSNKHYFSGSTQQVFISCSRKLEYFTWARRLSHPLRGDKNPGYLHLGTLLFILCPQQLLPRKKRDRGGSNQLMGPLTKRKTSLPLTLPFDKLDHIVQYTYKGAKKYGLRCAKRRNYVAKTQHGLWNVIPRIEVEPILSSEVPTVSGWQQTRPCWRGRGPVTSSHFLVLCCPTLGLSCM